MTALGFPSFDRLRCKHRTLFEVFRLPGNDERRRSIEDRDIAKRTLLALQHIKQSFGVVFSIAATQGFGFRTAEAGVFGAHLEVSVLAFSSSANIVRPAGVVFVKPFQ